MRLSDLKTGEKAIIVKVMGHGSFRKRIVEMGFIRGKEVEVLLNAPLQDPVKYKIMGYEVSLRRDEGKMIEVLSTEEVRRIKESSSPESTPAGSSSSETKGSSSPEAEALSAATSESSAPVVIDEADISEADKSEENERRLRRAALQKHREISVALVGNPNCGKTSLFNFASGAHERVGNYSGVTVDAKEGYAMHKGYRINLTDLPGTYSLSAYSPEEMYVRRQIIDKTPDVVINVIDSSNLERNLYLTTQLIDMNLRMVCALNMFDELENRGDKLNYQLLGTLFGVPMIPTVFTNGRGVEQLLDTVIKVYEEASNQALNKNVKLLTRHVHLSHGQQLEDCIDSVKKEIQKNQGIRVKYSTRYLAIKLLERDSETEKVVQELPEGPAIIAERDKQAKKILEETGEDSETTIMDAKYGIIKGALKEAGYEIGEKEDQYKLTHTLDNIITNKYLGFPIFFLILFLMFEVTFVLGQYPMDWIEAGVGWIGDMVSEHMPDGPLKDMIVGGIIAGVGSVIVFLPQILILYFFISFMEDSGYMSRAAFIVDKLMHKMGLHGKSFIPLIMGFGCNVPAEMATRTIESRRSRLVTMLILPFMSCSARLPIYIMITGTFFALKYQSLVMISLYAIGILTAVVVSKIFCTFLIKGEDTPFVMELPPYRMPTWKAIGRHTWEKGKQYLKKMGGIILVASIIVWALGYFPHHEGLTQHEQQEQSYIGQMGKAVAPIFSPQGFDWKLDVSLIAGVGAKEIVASTMGVLYADDESVAEDEDMAKYEKLRTKMEAEGITPLIAYAYLIFILLYFPCIATIVAIKNESGSWKWAIFAAVYTTAVAWVASAVVYQLGQLIY